MAVPLSVGETVVGAIVVSRRVGATWPESTRRILNGAAVEASAALSRAVSHRDAEVRAATDLLTGLPNRRYFDEFVGLLAHGRRAGDAVGILMVDIDKFKALNDEHGHATGDAGWSCAAWLRRSCRRCARTTSWPGSAARSSCAAPESCPGGRGGGRRTDPGCSPRADLRELAPAVSDVVGVAVAHVSRTMTSRRSYTSPIRNSTARSAPRPGRGRFSERRPGYHRGHAPRRPHRSAPGHPGRPGRRA